MDLLLQTEVPAVRGIPPCHTVSSFPSQAIDDDCNQTGQMTAGFLDWPQVGEAGGGERRQGARPGGAEHGPLVPALPGGGRRKAGQLLQ